MIDKKNPCKRQIFLMWNGLLKMKIYNNHIIIIIYISWKFQCTSLINSSFDDVLFLLIFLALLWHFFESTFFLFFVWKTKGCHFKSPLQVHNLLKIHPKNLWWFLLNFMTRWIIIIIIMLILNIALSFMFRCNPKKLEMQ